VDAPCTEISLPCSRSFERAILPSAADDEGSPATIRSGCGHLLCLLLMRDELAKLLICTNSTELAGYFNRLRRSAQKLLATCGAALRFRY